MKAIRWYDKEDVRLEDIPEPFPGKGEVKIKVEWCGICGTDLHEYEAGPIFIPTSPHPLTKKTPPVTLGHEFSGVIVEIGEGVSNWKKGDRVVVDACIVCGECYYCKNGMYHLCDKLGFNGLAADGGFAEYVIAPAYQLYKLDERMTFEEGALIEPIAVGVHAVRKSRFMEGDTAAVIGAGPIGLVTLQAVKAAGATKVYVLEVAEERKKFAEKLGADAVIDPTKENAGEKIKELTNGIGVNIAFECVGLEKTLTQAIEVTRKGGRIVVAGIFAGSFDGHIPYNDIVIGEKEIIGTIAYKGDFKYAIDLVADGRINAKELITKRISLENIVDEGFEELRKHKDKHIKILVSPSK
ncbi:2,3-butanediol dehydrogenase [Caldithrix abyssi]